MNDLVSELSLAPARIAIELNQKVVRRDQWAHTTLADGDRVEIVHFVGGGSLASARFTNGPLMPGNFYFQSVRCTVILEIREGKS